MCLGGRTVRPVLLGVAMFVPVLLAAGLVLGEMSGYGARGGAVAVPVGEAEEEDGTRSVAAQQEVSSEEEVSPWVSPSPTGGEATADEASAGRAREGDPAGGEGTAPARGGSQGAVTAWGAQKLGGVLAAPYARDVWGPVLASSDSAEAVTGWRGNAVGVVEPTVVPEPPHADREYSGVMSARYGARDGAAAQKAGENGPVSGTVEIEKVEKAGTSARSGRSERGAWRGPTRTSPVETAREGTAQPRAEETREAGRTVRAQPVRPAQPPADSGHRCPAQWKDTWLWESCMERIR